MKIQLEYKKYLDLEAIENKIKSYTIRIIAKVRLLNNNGWSEYQESIIDTGSPYSVIPYDLWKNAIVKKNYSTEIHGIVSKKSSFTKAIMGTIKCTLIDNKNISPCFEIKALLSETSDVPLIIGFSNILDQVKLIIDSPSKKCWINI